MNRARRQAGLTLLEIMIVLAIVGLLAGVLVFGYQRLPATVLRREANHLASAMRSAYDRAAASGAHHRLVIDLGERTYRVERCEGKVSVRKVYNQEEEDKRKQEEEEKQKLLEQARSTQQDAVHEAEAQAGQKVGRSAECASVKGEAGKLTTLSSFPEVKVARVYVRHLERPAEEGKVQVHFFPMGRAERAVVELQVGDDIVSVAVQPLSGRVRIVSGKWPNPEEFVSEDAEGKGD